MSHLFMNIIQIIIGKRAFEVQLGVFLSSPSKIKVRILDWQSLPHFSSAT